MGSPKSLELSFWEPQICQSIFRSLDISLDKWKLWPTNGIGWKVIGSLKSGQWMSVQTFAAIHSVVVEIFQLIWTKVNQHNCNLQSHGDNMSRNVGHQEFSWSPQFDMICYASLLFRYITFLWQMDFVVHLAQITINWKNKTSLKWVFPSLWYQIGFITIFCSPLSKILDTLWITQLHPAVRGPVISKCSRYKLYWADGWWLQYL